MPPILRSEGAKPPDGSQGGWTEMCQIWEDIGLSSALTKFVLDLRYVAPFRNAGGSEVFGVKNRGQILHFLPPP